MSPERQIYLLDPQTLKPEIIAVAFAKTSRSPQSFREIAKELTDEKSAEFHEKWVVGYGHASVAEHAILHVAVENISRLAVESLESNRLASYTEKSTRYQKWGPDDFFTPPELLDHPLLQRYQQTVRSLFESYLQSLPVVRGVIAAENPRGPSESDGAYERRIRSDYVDVCRFLLPAASLANVGMTINARALEHAIRKMLSHPLAEVRQLGEEIKQVVQQEVPTLVKYADAVAYLKNAQTELEIEARGIPTSQTEEQDWCRMVHYEPEGEKRAMAAALFRQGDLSYTQALNYVRTLDTTGQNHLAMILLGSAGKFDIPLREIEHTNFTVEVTLDQGAYVELKRHRMMTQSPQALTPHLGYAIPRAISQSGLEPVFRQAVENASAAYAEIAQVFPAVASYVVPNACNRRVLMTFNLRSADHFVALRSAPNAHFSIRRVAQRLFEQINEVAPFLGAQLRVCPGETWQGIEQRYFTQVNAQIKG
jgi:thymidylate synthase ThyX